MLIIIDIAPSFASNEENTDIMYIQAKAIGYIELYAYIEDEISKGNYTFYEKELRGHLEKHLKNQGYEITKLNTIIMSQ